MKQKLLSSIVLICALLVIPVMSLNAKTVYVRNWIVISLRAEPDETSESIATANTNDSLIALEQGDGWTMVQTPKGKKGWVQTRYLTTQPPATVSTQQCEEQIKALREENTRLQGLISSSKQGTISPVPQAGQTSAAAPAVSTFPSDCSTIQKEYDKLQKDHKALVEKFNAVTEENDRLKTSERLTFTVIGGVFIIFGIIIGLLLQLVRSHPKKGGLKF
jgi:SH3 domain protein